MITEDDFKNMSVTARKRTRKILAHAAEHRKLYDQVETLRRERDRYQRIVTKLYGQMVTPVNPDELPYESSPSLRRWKVMVGDGVFYEFDGLTQQEAETVWREAWDLELI